MSRLRLPSLALLLLGVEACRPPAGGQAVPPRSAGTADEALLVEADLWRNFQPRADRPDTALAAIIRVRTPDRRPLPATLRVERAVLRHGRQTWHAVLRQEQPSWSPDALEVIARGGPPWAPGSVVDVTVNLRDERGQTRRLVLRAQRVRRLD